MFRRAKSPAGFTMVELLVALGLTIFLLALFTTLMVAATGSINTSQGIGAVDQHVRNAVTTLRDDLQKIYLAHDGTPLAVSQLFTDPDKIPTEGYFLLEENDRAIRQGLDAAGIPVEVDTDDVLAFTVGNPSASRRDDFYYGRVFNSQGQTIVPLDNQGRIQDLGNYLDNSFGNPTASYDTPGNNLISSRFAEVVYFLRPDKRQYSVNDIRGDITTGSIPSVPATYTLYRRQLIVLENGERLNHGSDIAPAGVPLDSSPNPGNSLIPGRPNATATFHDLFDISATRQFEIPADGTAIRWGFNDDGTPGTIGRIHFNTLADLSQREYRFGMRRFEFDTAIPRVLRSLPMSHFIPNGETTPYSIAHNYRSADASNPTPSDANIVQWIGRPLQAETNHPNFPFSPPALDGTNDHSVVDDTTPQDGILDIANAAPFGQRFGDDVLLTNVISFDVKVFEENTISPGTTISPYLASASTSVNPLDAALIQSRALLPLYDDNTYFKDDTEKSQLNSRIRRSEFVDLGYAYDFADLFNDNNTYVPATFWPAMAPNCKTLTNYFYHPTLSRFGLPFNPANPLFDTGSALPGAFRFGPDEVDGSADDVPATRMTELTAFREAFRGPNAAFGDGTDWTTYLEPFFDDIPISAEAPYAGSGLVGTIDAAAYPGSWTNPRNTYDSWSEAYGANPLLPPPPANTPDPNFRPVPYPRPLKGIQIKLRVLEPKTGIVRDFTLRHYFREKN